MKKLLRKKYVLGFIAYYILYILMLLLVNWYNATNQESEWTSIFTKLSTLDGTLAPILFAAKFLYASAIHLFPSLSDKSLLLPYLRELNIFTFFYLGMVSYLLKSKEVQFKWVYTYVLTGYFIANYFVTTLIVFLTLLV